MERERIYVIGGREMVLGFSLLGIAGSTPENREQLASTLRERFADVETALILVDEELVAQVPKLVDELQTRSDLPVVVEIPGAKGPLGERNIKEYIAGAIGIRL